MMAIYNYSLIALYRGMLTLCMICCHCAPKARRDLQTRCRYASDDHKMKPVRCASRLFLAAFAYCVFGDTLCEIPPYKELFFEQQADHFNFYERNLEKPTFNQRYLIQGGSILNK